MDGWTRVECQAQGGNWNMASTCEEMQIIESTCKINGEISILGITIKGAFEKGKNIQLHMHYILAHLLPQIVVLSKVYMQITIK